MGKLSHADVVHLLIQLSAMLVMGRIFAEASTQSSSASGHRGNYRGDFAWPNRVGNVSTRMV